MDVRAPRRVCRAHTLLALPVSVLLALMAARALRAGLVAADSHSPDFIGGLARWTRTNRGRIDGLYISPVQPDAAAYVAEVVRELVRRYAVDGVYLDHVSYPGDDFDYSR